MSPEQALQTLLVLVGVLFTAMVVWIQVENAQHTLRERWDAKIQEALDNPEPLTTDTWTPYPDTRTGDTRR